MRVKWENWEGERFEGEVKEVDCNVLHVKFDDGTMKAVEMDGVEVCK